ncbi:MAG: SBBP repeat-containing protein [Bacteroidetes bacterium]|nr:SBBP repeat-containing protein [Bacteroidota bacterium]
MKRVFILFLMICPYQLMAQSWEWAKQIGGPGVDQAFISHIDSQHNIYLYGTYAKPFQYQKYYNCYIEEDTLFGSSDAFIAKYNDSGNLQWVKNCVSPLGNMNIVFAFDTLNNVIYLAGSYDNSCSIDTCHLYSGSNGTGFLAKINVDGNCLWIKNIATPQNAISYGTSLAVDNNGNVFMGGYSNATNIIDTSTIAAGTFLAKFDPNGNNLWAKTKFPYSGYQSQIHFLSLRCINNCIYASGNAYSASINDTLRIDTVSITDVHGTGYDLICMDANNSNAKWMKFEGQPNTIFSDPMMDIDKNGNIYCTGIFFGTCIFSHDTLIANSENNGLLLKYDSTGKLLWKEQLFSSYSIGCTGVNAQNDSTVIITGFLTGQGTLGNFIINANTPEDLFIACYNKNGDVLGVDNAGVAMGLSIASDESSIYTTGQFPPESAPGGSYSITMGNNTFTNYGWADIVFAKHEMIAGVKEKEKPSENHALKIYGNPNKGSFRVKIPQEFIHKDNLILNIFNSNGKLLKSQTLHLDDHNSKTDLNGIASGFYSVTLSDGTTMYTGKMIVE